MAANDDDWGPLVNDVSSSSRGSPDAPSATKNEYIKAVLKEGGHFSIPNCTVELTRGCGHIEMEVHQPRYFQIIEQLYGSHRPKVVPLDVEDGQTVAMNAHLSTGRPCGFGADSSAVTGLLALKEEQATRGAVQRGVSNAQIWVFEVYHQSGVR